MQRQIHIVLQSSCTNRTSQTKMLTLQMLSWLTRWLLGLPAIACTSSGSNSMVWDIMAVAYAASGMLMVQGRGGMWAYLQAGLPALGCAGAAFEPPCRAAVHDRQQCQLPAWLLPLPQLPCAMPLLCASAQSARKHPLYAVADVFFS